MTARPWWAGALIATMGALAPVGVGAGAAATPATTVAPPTSIADDCTSDVTAALNSWFASVPANSTINLPADACYLVSNTSPTLTFEDLKGLTINGNNTTFRQTTYEDGQCGNNAIQPILQLRNSTNLTFSQITLDGPGNCGGGSNEGDYGLELGQSNPGNSNITFDGVSVQNTDGDGMAVLPQLGTCCGINTNITFENGAMTNIGYHVFTSEGVNGLKILNNNFANDGNFMDMEVDNNDDPVPPGTIPTGNAQWNIAIKDNTFTDNSALEVDSLQGTCIPQRNLVIVGNVLDTTSRGFSMQLGGSESSACPQDTGLTIEDNNSVGPGSSPCGGSIVGGPACSMIEIADYTEVHIKYNRFTAFDGAPSYFPNTIYVPCITLQGVTLAVLSGNVCTNAYDVWDSDNAQFPSGDFTNSGITTCHNTYGLTWPMAPVGEAAPAAAPRTEIGCSSLGAVPVTRIRPAMGLSTPGMVKQSWEAGVLGQLAHVPLPSGVCEFAADSKTAAPAVTMPTDNKTDPTQSSGVCQCAPTTARDISRTQKMPRKSPIVRARFPSTGLSASHMASAAALTAVTLPEGKVSSASYVRWTSGLTRCSLVSTATAANPAKTTTRERALRTNPRQTETATAAPMAGSPRYSTRSAQAGMAEGGPSQASARFSRGYGLRPCATAKAKTAVARRDNSAVTVSLARSTRANYATRLQPPRSDRPDLTTF